MNILIAESEEGAYEPISVVSSSMEAVEIAKSDMAKRKIRLENGYAPMCPYIYKVWGPNMAGEMGIKAEIEP